MKQKQTHVPIPERAVLRRINWKLRKEHLLLKKARPGLPLTQIGEYYLLDTKSYRVVTRHVDLMALAKKRDCLRPWETVMEEPQTAKVRARR